jgi:hypothetical protein
MLKNLHDSKIHGVWRNCQGLVTSITFALEWLGKLTESTAPVVLSVRKFPRPMPSYTSKVHLELLRQIKVDLYCSYFRHFPDEAVWDSV